MCSDNFRCNYAFTHFPTLGLCTGATPLAPGQSVAQPQVQPPPSIRPAPSQLELSKMIWSIMAAVDHAILSGNYSVLRDISAQGFQIQNNAARLTDIFAAIRNSRADLSNTLLVPPTYTQAPQMVQEDIFRVQGQFQMRPSSPGVRSVFSVGARPVETGRHRFATARDDPRRFRLTDWVSRSFRRGGAGR